MQQRDQTTSHELYLYELLLFFNTFAKLLQQPADSLWNEFAKMKQNMALSTNIGVNFT